ncbi:MAG: hypothetical protein HY512_04305 [Candidatus Aenigmarchaeota archaeon]|nr:hypothetical protein [Candidatus Aenigmarchaeota archaeon]
MGTVYFFKRERKVTKSLSTYNERKRIAMDEFIIVLIIAFVLLIGMGIFFNLGPTTAPPPEPIIKDVSIDKFSLGTIGYSGSSVSSSYSIEPFVAGAMQTETAKTVTEFDVSAHIIFGGTPQSFTITTDPEVLRSIEASTIEFDIEDTNKYGNLVVKWNGEELLNKELDKGRQKLRVEREKVKDVNTLEFTTAGSWRFWANTIYKIKDLRIDHEYGQSKVSQFALSQRELETLDKIEVTFSGSVVTPGKLLVKANGFVVFEKNYVGGSERFSFNHQTLPLSVGNNALSFVAQGGGLFNVDSSRVEVFSSSTAVEKRRSFTVTESQFNLLNKTSGVININVSNILKPGSLTVAINNRSVQINPQTGINHINFNKADVVVGENNLKFTATGNLEIPQVVVKAL